jgi:hypothetical protein
MNFDDLKGAWADDTVAGSQLPKHTIPVQKTSTTISKIRKNMKFEFIMQIVSYTVVIILYFLFSKTALSVFIVSVSAFILLMQSAYYFFRFYLFYKAADRYDLSIRNSIRKIIYDLELNIEIYRTWSYCAMPLATLTFFAMVWGGALLEVVKKLLIRGMSDIGFLVWFFILLLLAQVITVFFINLHIRLQYGRYLKELKKLMEDIETEE